MSELQSLARFVNQSLTLTLCCNLLAMPLSADDHGPTTTTPIKHVVVIFQENRSFDQYFAGYPYAANLSGESPFFARPHTPSVNGLLTAGLLTSNPNSANPQRLGPAGQCDCVQRFA